MVPYFTGIRGAHDLSLSSHYPHIPRGIPLHLTEFHETLQMRTFPLAREAGYQIILSSFSSYGTLKVECKSGIHEA
jgi:hypothetical protein